MALQPETKVPSVPNPGQDPDGFMRAIQEIVQVREGARGNPLDRGVTFRDLVNAGLAAPNPAFAGKGRLPASVMITPTPGNVGTGGKPDLTVPPMPRDVAVVGTFSSILVSWAQPDYSNHAYAEILRADVNDIGQAVIIGSSVGRQYADAVGESAEKYYWVRFVSIQNAKGPASVGKRGKTALSAEFVMANLLAQTWQAATAYSLFQYVMPTTNNGLMYRVSQEGISGATEPVWPTVIGQTITDGTVRWTAVAADERVPFIIGTVNGEPAVVIDSAYIGDATITAAMIKEAFIESLVAIQGKLTFAVIEQGNIFELAIGGDIRSETFSPLYNTGFIIRNEPGRDPSTPGTRQYTAEFYGDTLFSGDIRAARVLGGIVVAQTLAVPSCADNGSFEYIANREVINNSVTAFRADPTISPLIYPTRDYLPPITPGYWPGTEVWDKYDRKLVVPAFGVMSYNAISRDTFRYRYRDGIQAQIAFADGSCIPFIPQTDEFLGGLGYTKVCNGIRVEVVDPNNNVLDSLYLLGFPKTFTNIWEPFRPLPAYFPKSIYFFDIPDDVYWNPNTITIEVDNQFHKISMVLSRSFSDQPYRIVGGGYIRFKNIAYSNIGVSGINFEITNYFIDFFGSDGTRNYGEGPSKKVVHYSGYTPGISPAFGMDVAIVASTSMDNIVERPCT